ncbi:MAG: hypothetical protein ABSE17_03165 [Candidatus Levyibacteriota bacterium]|jgi:hypothetical protein
MATSPENRPYGLMDNTAAFLSALITPFIAIYIAYYDTKIALLSLAAGEIAARTIYVVGKNRHKNASHS